MSDHESGSSGKSGYDTPVPELDDHRQQISFAQQLERPRRGTADTLYGQRNDLPGSPEIRVRDFEEAVADEDTDEVSPIQRSRRPTVESSVDPRSASPPNSVKAFAEARRRACSFSDKEDGGALRRTLSTVSRHSQRSYRSSRSKAKTVDNDAASLVTNKTTAEEDVCFPVQEEHRRDRLYIDFDYLENFIAAQKAANLEALRAKPIARAFPGRRPETADNGVPPMVTVDGDILVPAPSTVTDEKVEQSDEEPPVIVPKEPFDPNRYSFFSSAWESTIHAAEFGDLVLPGESVKGLFSLPQDEDGEPDGVWWLNINSPSEDEVRGICKAFGVHPLTIEDIQSGENREKIEIFPAYYFASFRSFYIQEEDGEPDYEPFNLYVIVFREGTLSFSSKPNDHASNVRARIMALKEYVSLSSDWICYALIDNIVDSFAAPIQDIENATEGLEMSVFVARPDDMHVFLRKLGAVRKNTLGLMRILGGKADVLKGFTKRCNENYKVTPRMDIGLYLGDIQDHVVTMMTNLTHFEKILSRAHSNYLAQLTIDSISQGTKTNQGLTKITYLASVIVPLNVVTGLFGMNVDVPWREVGNIVPFMCILGSMLTFVLLSIIVARRMRYI